MAREKKRSVESKVARKFIKSLAHQLTSGSNNGSCLVCSADLEEVLRRSTLYLPAGKLRSTLLRIQRQPHQQDAFVVTLQEEMRAVAAKRELDDDDDVPTTTATERLLETLSSWLRGKGTAAFTATTRKQLISSEDRQLLLSRDPPAHVLWAMAALELSSPGGANSPALTIPSSAKALLLCLKPLVVGNRSACTAVVTLAPLAPLMFEILQQSSSRTQNNIKVLRAVVREVLSFIVVVNNKEKCMKDSPTETLSFSSLWDGFSSIFEALKLKSHIAQMEVLSATERLKLMFPLTSKLTEKVLKLPDVKVDILSNIVKIEFVLFQMILEVIHWREKTRTRDMLIKTPIEVLSEMVGTIAVHSVAAAENDKDLILDLLLSHLSISDMVDDEEKVLIYISLYKALLIGGQGFIVTPVDETSEAKKKNIRNFLKTIAVGRKITCGQRSKVGRSILEELASKLNVPRELAECLKSGEVTKIPPENVALIGWLLHLEDMDFQAIVDGTSQEEDYHDADRSSSRDAYFETEPEALFFLDTTGEEEEDKGSGPGNRRPS